MLASLLNLPVAGTALTVADSYLTARSLSTPLCPDGRNLPSRQANVRRMLLAAWGFFDSSADGNLRNRFLVAALGRFLVARQRQVRCSGACLFRACCRSLLINIFSPPKAPTGKHWPPVRTS